MIGEKTGGQSEIFLGADRAADSEHLGDEFVTKQPGEVVTLLR